MPRLFHLTLCGVRGRTSHAASVSATISDCSSGSLAARPQHPNWYLRAFCYEKKQQAKRNLRTKKFLWLTGTTFGRGRKYDSQPLPLLGVASHCYQLVVAF